MKKTVIGLLMTLSSISMPAIAADCTYKFGKSSFLSDVSVDESNYFYHKDINEEKAYKVILAKKGWTFDPNSENTFTVTIHEIRHTRNILNRFAYLDNDVLLLGFAYSITDKANKAVLETKQHKYRVTYDHGDGYSGKSTILGLFRSMANALDEISACH